MQRLTNKLFGVVAAGLMMLMTASPGSAQVAVNIANAVDGSAGETGTVGVYVGSLDGENVLAYDFTVQFDASEITITGYNAAGTISDGINLNAASTDTTFRVVGASGEALEGSGALIWLEYELVADGPAGLELTEFTFNDGTPAVNNADVALRLPNTGAEPEQVLLIPVFTDDIDGEGVLSYDFTVTFDSDVIVFDGIETSGTLSEGASVNFSPEDGSIRVVGAAGSAFEGSGVLVYLTGMAANVEGSATALTFSEITLNDGDPSSAAIDGSIEVATGNEAENPNELPGSFALHGNYPNPFNPSTTIRFDLPATAEVSVQIFDVLGRQVMALPSTMVQAGADQSLQVNASALTSGTYVYRVIARSATETMIQSGQMTLVK